MLCFAKTDTGLVRTENQDAFYTKTLDENTQLAIVCDGMGGSSGGNVASEIAVKAASLEIEKNYKPNFTDAEYKRMFEKAMEFAHTAIHSLSEKDKELEGMGTTCVICIVHNGRAHVSHVGDSRAYHITDQEIVQITKDQSYVQQMIDAGNITKEEAKTHPQRNIILQALGVEKSARPDYTVRVLDDKEMILICTDGLSNYVDDDKVFGIIKNNDIEKVCGILVDTVNNNGGSDNTTVVLIG